MTIATPGVAVAMTCWICLAKNWRLEIDVAGFVIGAAALIIGGVLAAFAQLSSWRTALADRDSDEEHGLRAMVDEAATHMLLAVLEAVCVTVFAVFGVLLTELGFRNWSLLAVALVVGLGFHIALLLALAIPRLYSAYVQVNHVDTSMDGYASDVPPGTAPLVSSGHSRH